MQVGGREQLSRTIRLCARISMRAAIKIKPCQDNNLSSSGLKFQPNVFSPAPLNRQDELFSSVIGKKIPVLIHGHRSRQLKHGPGMRMLGELEQQIGLGLR